MPQFPTIYDPQLVLLSFISCPLVFECATFLEQRPDLTLTRSLLYISLLCIKGVDIILPEDVAGEPAQDITSTVLFNALQEAGVTTPKGISINTNMSAFLSFMTIQEVRAITTTPIIAFIVIITTS
jgi:hypothetical protein